MRELIRWIGVLGRCIINNIESFQPFGYDTSYKDVLKFVYRLIKQT